MKDKKILIILVPILFAALSILSYLKIINVSKSTDDSIKFKEEYEVFNNKKASSGKKYKKLNINKNNRVKYSNYDELIDIIKNKTGIIYLGYPTCPWCRSAIPVLFEVVKDNNINTIYYLNIEKERDYYIVEDEKLTYALDDNGKEMKGTDGYFKLLDALDEHLSDYVISVDGKKYEVGEKRIYAPSVIFVKDGKVIGIHVSTVASQSSGYDALTKEEHDELYSIYEDYIIELKNSTCSIGSSC